MLKKIVKNFALFIASLAVVIGLCCVLGDEKQSGDVATAGEDQSPTSIATEYYSPEVEKAHPEARRLMKEDWFWNICDDDSPFGSDDGADACNSYHNWRLQHPGVSSMDGVAYVFERMEASFDQWRKVCDRQEGQTNFWDKFVNVRPGDRIIIAIAFGQLADQGFIDEPVRRYGLLAVQNELRPDELKHWMEPAVRERRLKRMKEVLKKAPTKAKAEKPASTTTLPSSTHPSSP